MARMGAPASIFSTWVPVGAPGLATDNLNGATTDTTIAELAAIANHAFHGFIDHQPFPGRR